MCWVILSSWSSRMQRYQLVGWHWRRLTSSAVYWQVYSDESAYQTKQAPSCYHGLCLQYVFNAAARIIAGLPHSAHISTTLANLHWFHTTQCIKFKLVTLMFHCFQGFAPHHLSTNFIWISDVPSRRRLLSTSTNSLSFLPSWLFTVGDRSFPVTCANLWNGLPDELTSLQYNFLSSVNLRRFFVSLIISWLPLLGNLIIITDFNIYINIEVKLKGEASVDDVTGAVM